MNGPTATHRYIVSVSRVSVSTAVYGLYLLVAGLVAIYFGVGSFAPGSALPLVIVVAIVLGGGGLWFVAPRSVVLDVGPLGVFVDDRRGHVSPVATRQIGVWHLAMYGVAAGSALHLQAGDKHLTIGGRDHRLALDVRLDAPPTTSIDFTLSAAEFDALLVALGMPWAQNQRPGAGVTRCTLSPNHVGGPLLGRKRGLFLDFEGWQVRVVDMATGTTLAAADARAVRAEPVEHTYTGKLSLTVPGLILEIPGFESLHVCTPDMRFGWSVRARSVGAAPNVVGGPDWLFLAGGFCPAALVVRS